MLLSQYDEKAVKFQLNVKEDIIDTELYAEILVMLTTHDSRSLDNEVDRKAVAKALTIKFGPEKFKIKVE